MSKKKTSEPVIDHLGNKGWLNGQGQFHRVGEPAFALANGSKFWFLDGILHREYGPAVEFADGEKYWFQKGLLHRVGGPAVERADGRKEWWLNGFQQEPPRKSSPTSEK